MPEVIIRISPSGNINLEVEGVKGNGCLSLTQGLEAGLGQIQSKIEKPEMYQMEELIQGVTNGNGTGY